MGSLAPGKGGFFHLNGDTLGFFTMAMSELYDVLAQEGTRDVNEALDNGDAVDLFKQAKAELVEDESGTWSFEKDKFGQKVYKVLPWDTGAYRVTLVLTKDDELKLDVRQWYDPNDERSSRRS